MKRLLTILSILFLLVSAQAQPPKTATGTANLSYTTQASVSVTVTNPPAFCTQGQCTANATDIVAIPILVSWNLNSSYTQVGGSVYFSSTAALTGNASGVNIPTSDAFAGTSSGSLNACNGQPGGFGGVANATCEFGFNFGYSGSSGPYIVNNQSSTVYVQLQNLSGLGLQADTYTGVINILVGAM